MKNLIRFSCILVLFLSIPRTVVACTSFCLDSNGFPVFGTNLDNRIHQGLLFVNKRNVTKTAWDPGATGEYAEWTAKYGSVTFNFAGYQFAWAGMNEAGLVISTMFLDVTENPPSDERPPLESGFWVQYQLDNAKTIEDVIASNSVVRIANTIDHYLVCDRTGNCAVIEFIEGEMVVHADETMPVRVLTNNTYEESINSWKKSSLRKFFQRLFSKPGPSLIRFEIAANRVKDFNENGKEPAVDYAFDTLQRACGESAGSSPTQWSIVFDTEDLQIHFRTRTNPEIRSISLAMLNFSCSAPVRMLDIHQNLSGDISNDFIGYSYQVSLSHFLRFFEKWGPANISPDRTKALTKHLESFECNESKE